MVTTQIVGLGTSERVWTQWLGSLAMPGVDLEIGDRRVVVVAAHPDDEVLGVGGLMRRLAQRHQIVVVWVSDGEASHPGSTAIAPHRLAALRRAESQRAVTRLGVSPAASHHLALPDSALAEYCDALRDALVRIVRPDDLVISNWSGDGHPDHEAVGEVVTSLDVRCWQYPVWMWHWAGPDDDRVPWGSLRAFADVDVAAKVEAISCFVTQVEAIGPEPADAAVLPPHVIERFTRPVEVVFT